MKKTKVRFLCAGIVMLCTILLACGNSPTPAKTASQSDELDAVIRETSDYLNNQLPKGNKLVILNIQSDFPALSEYIIDELIANTVNDKIFSVVDRQQLNTIRAELNFQISGEVSDASAQSIGQMLGAQVIISGAVSKVGDLYRLRVRALNVQSAEIAGQFNKNIPNNSTVAALVNSKATGYGDNAAPASTSTKPVASVPAAAPAPTNYKVGDKGPAGGWVFYDKGVVTNGWRYLEAAPHDVGPTQWGTLGTDVKGTSTAIGTGKVNTQRIVSALNQAGDDGAALLCTALNINGYTDWFLPSITELGFMYATLKTKGLGGFGDSRYWSSSQINNRSVWEQNFSNGEQFGGDWMWTGKTDAYNVRACRQF